MRTTKTRITTTVGMVTVILWFRMLTRISVNATPSNPNSQPATPIDADFLSKVQHIRAEIEDLYQLALEAEKQQQQQELQQQQQEQIQQKQEQQEEQQQEQEIKQHRNAVAVEDEDEEESTHRKRKHREHKHKEHEEQEHKRKEHKRKEHKHKHEKHKLHERKHHKRRKEKNRVKQSEGIKRSGNGRTADSARESCSLSFKGDGFVMVNGTKSLIAAAENEDKTTYRAFALDVTLFIPEDTSTENPMTVFTVFDNLLLPKKHKTPQFIFQVEPFKIYIQGRQFVPADYNFTSEEMRKKFVSRKIEISIPRGKSTRLLFCAKVDHDLRSSLRKADKSKLPGYLAFHNVRTKDGKLEKTKFGQYMIKQRTAQAADPIKQPFYVLGSQPEKTVQVDKVTGKTADIVFSPFVGRIEHLDFWLDYECPMPPTFFRYEVAPDLTLPAKGMYGKNVVGSGSCGKLPGEPQITPTVPNEPGNPVSPQLSGVTAGSSSKADPMQGAIAAWVAGLVLGVAVVAGVFIFIAVMKRRRAAAKEEEEEEGEEGESEDKGDGLKIYESKRKRRKTKTANQNRNRNRSNNNNRYKRIESWKGFVPWIPESLFSEDESCDDDDDDDDDDSEDVSDDDDDETESLESLTSEMIRNNFAKKLTKNLNKLKKPIEGKKLYE